MIPRGQVNQVSMAADSYNNMTSQCVLIKGLALNSSSTSSHLHIDDDNIISIQLLYDSNRPMEPGLWNGNFHPILLHGSLEHLVSDVESIKDFEGIGKTAWDLISSIYESEWDSLIADNHKNSFRQKVIYKFTPRINLDKNNKKKKIITNKPTNIKRLPPLIPAKSLKEINKISKYFKPKKSTKTILSKVKSYAQTMKNISNTEEVLKIKEAFSFL